MNKTLAEKIEIAFKATQKMIDDTEKKLAKAITEENWLLAAELSAYIHGMMQTQAIFEGAVPSAKVETE